MKPPLSFYDVKSKSKFSSEEWRIEMKESRGKTRYFAVSKVPGAAHEAWLIVKEEFAKSNM
ncbi:MAG: hypothetical protein A2Z17_02135 [Gammaproteobacteria bacterium RBG_16_66_13]|nr:MAG: hypothetical protein A2Z17_02135 [Gammaproteobacteria bacterium RBG_16_66_13]